MDDEYFGDGDDEALVVGSYASGQLFGPVLQLLRCGECNGLYKQNHYRFIMGVQIFVAPTSQEAIRRRKQAAEHNQKLDKIFFDSKRCSCHGRNS